MEIMLVRHGQTQGNLEGRYVGRTDEPLLGASVEQLKQLQAEYRLFREEKIYCSPMLRCRQTAEILFGTDQFTLCRDLRETDFGEFEYKNYAELNGDPAYQAWIDSGGMIAFPGGESGKIFRERCCNAFLQCVREAAAQGYSRVAFVVHGGTIMSVMEHFALPAAPFYSWQVKNGCGFRCVWEEEHLVQGRKIPER